MFIKSTPESVGISSEQVLKYLKIIEMQGIASHSILMARGNRIFCEAYWSPFEKTTKHRMYSQTKSYVGIAVRLLADEGRISLDDKIISYFPEKLPEKIHPNLEKLTIRNMLMMRTCFDEYSVNWFTSKTDDRVKLYFSQKPAVYPGTQYNYDSMGSFVLGALVEKITGKCFLDYMREKCLDKIGFSKDAYCLKCPGGYSWADSALICTPLDMLAYGRLVGCKGKWNGEQVVREGLFDEALADRTSCHNAGHRSFDHREYSSQLWNFFGDAVGFNGMHDQVTFYDPKTDITFTCTSGNYRSDDARALLISYAFSEIVNTACEKLEENNSAYAELEDYIGSLKLVTAAGKTHSKIEKEINGKKFIAEPNESGITEFSFDFDKNCTFNYKNEQGNKTIVLGRSENVFQQFPQTGYSASVGGTECEGHTYKCAASCAWGSENQLMLYVQIIDEYIGNLYIVFSYKDGHGRLQIVGDAENFLTEYKGHVNAVVEK